MNDVHTVTPLFQSCSLLRPAQVNKTVWLQLNTLYMVSFPYLLSWIYTVHPSYSCNLTSAYSSGHERQETSQRGQWIRQEHSSGPLCLFSPLRLEGGWRQRGQIKLFHAWWFAQPYIKRGIAFATLASLLVRASGLVYVSVCVPACIYTQAYRMCVCTVSYAH